MLEETDPVEVPAVPLEDSQEVEVAPISAAAEPTEVSEISNGTGGVSADADGLTSSPDMIPMEAAPVEEIPTEATPLEEILMEATALEYGNGVSPHHILTTQPDDGNHGVSLGDGGEGSGGEGEEEFSTPIRPTKPLEPSDMEEPLFDYGLVSPPKFEMNRLESQVFPSPAPTRLDTPQTNSKLDIESDLEIVSVVDPKPANELTRDEILARLQNLQVSNPAWTLSNLLSICGLFSSLAFIYIYMDLNL